MKVRRKDTQLEEAKRAAETCVRVLKERFGARNVYLFGSVAGQAPWHSRSDIDLGVEGLPPGKYMAALSALYELLPDGLDLDLVTLEDAPPELAARIRGEITMPDDPKAALKQQILNELTNLGRIVQEAKRLLERLPDQPDSLDVRAGGSLVHDFYTGIERIFERIELRLGPGSPAGEGWHTLLLRGMESAVEGIRPEVIDRSLALRLLDYLRFRHLFRHTYGYELQWDKLRPLIEGMEETLTVFHERLQQFLNRLQG